MYRLLRATFFILAFVSAAVFSSFAWADEHRPFQPGEKMHFVLKYGAINAGIATLEVHEMDEIMTERQRQIGT